MTLPVIARAQPRVGAFFDLDKTLIAENSGSLYMRYRYQRGEISGYDLLKGVGAYLLSKKGYYDHLLGFWHAEADLEQATGAPLQP